MIKFIEIPVCNLCDKGIVELAHLLVAIPRPRPGTIS